MKLTTSDGFNIAKHIINNAQNIGVLYPQIICGSRIQKKATEPILSTVLKHRTGVENRRSTVTGLIRLVSVTGLAVIVSVVIRSLAILSSCNYILV